MGIMYWSNMDKETKFMLFINILCVLVIALKLIIQYIGEKLKRKVVFCAEVPVNGRKWWSFSVKNDLQSPVLSAGCRFFHGSRQ